MEGSSSDRISQVWEETEKHVGLICSGKVAKLFSNMLLYKVLYHFKLNLFWTKYLAELNNSQRRKISSSMRTHSSGHKILTIQTQSMECQPNGFYLRRISCVVLIMIWNLPACEEGVFHFGIMTLSSLGLHISVSILELKKRTFIIIQRKFLVSTSSVKNNQRQSLSARGGDFTEQFFSYCVVGRIHCVVLLSWLTKKVLPRLSCRSSQPGGRAGSSWLCLGPDMSWDSRNSHPGWTKQTRTFVANDTDRQRRYWTGSWP